MIPAALRALTAFLADSRFGTLEKPASGAASKSSPRTFAMISAASILVVVFETLNVPSV